MFTVDETSVILTGNKKIQDTSPTKTTLETTGDQIRITDSEKRSLLIEGKVEYDARVGNAFITLPDGTTVTANIEPGGKVTYKNRADTANEWKKHFEEIGTIATHKDILLSLQGSIEFTNARVQFDSSLLSEVFWQVRKKAA